MNGLWTLQSAARQTHQCPSQPHYCCCVRYKVMNALTFEVFITLTVRSLLFALYVTGLFFVRISAIDCAARMTYCTWSGLVTLCDVIRCLAIRVLRVVNTPGVIHPGRHQLCRWGDQRKSRALLQVGLDADLVCCQLSLLLLVTQYHSARTIVSFV